MKVYHLKVILPLVKKSNMVDAATKKTLAAIPLLKTKAGPRDGDEWINRLKEEYQSLIKVSRFFYYSTLIQL